MASAAIRLHCSEMEDLEEGTRKRGRQSQGEGGDTKKHLDTTAWWMMVDEEPEDDPEAARFFRFRDEWVSLWSNQFGCFEDQTLIGPMRFTENYDPARRRPLPENTLQIFSVKIAKLRDDVLHWPLQVYGVVAARDCIDHNRNIIFHRPREDCQTLTQQSPYLALSGPTRAIVVVDPVFFEVDLKVKGAVESDDKDLSTIVDRHRYYSAPEFGLVKREYTNKLSALEWTFGRIVTSVEATIQVQALDRSFPHGFRGKVTACTARIDMEVVLLDSGNDRVAVNADGMIELSRRVVSVELGGALKVEVVAAEAAAQDSKVFTPKKDGRSSCTLTVGTCKMEVTVAWSRFSLLPKYWRKDGKLIPFGRSLV